MNNVDIIVEYPGNYELGLLPIKVYRNNLLEIDESFRGRGWRKYKWGFDESGTFYILRCDGIRGNLVKQYADAIKKRVAELILTGDYRNDL